MASSQPAGEPAPTDGSLPEQVVLGAAERTFHAYVHVPFCSVRCGYCDFNTYTSDELRGERQADFIDRLSLEVQLSGQVLEAANLPARKVSTVFFGGGTPTLLPATDLTRALIALKSTFGIQPEAEVTTEANPDTVDHKYAESLAEAGFNRISVGMQSADVEVLRVLDRTHNPANVSLAISAAKSFDMQTSVDLIYGSPGETLKSFETTLLRAIELETDHISAYSLIVEPGTKLARQIKQGAVAEPDEDLQADMYLLADEVLSQAGYNWYEVSNWSKSDSTRSEHNMAYWQGQDWWGYGPGSHSHIGGVRWWNSKHPSTYAQSLLRSESPAAGREILNATTQFEERLMLGLRTKSGVAIEGLSDFVADKASRISQLIADGWIEGKDAVFGRVVLTLEGRLFADAVVKRLLF
jgi:putative oxygen-independent coproporphyrinogen III oxidase